MPTGGDVLEITFNNSEKGSGVVYAKSTEDSSYMTGDYMAQDDNAGVDGSGEPMNILNRTRWSFECTISWDMNVREELEKLVSLAGSTVETDFTISHINGTVYGGVGRPVGDLVGNANAVTIPLKLAGGGVLKKIVG